MRALASDARRSALVALAAASVAVAACSGAPAAPSNGAAPSAAPAPSAPASALAPQASAAPSASAQAAAPSVDGLALVKALPLRAGPRFELVASYADFLPKEECLHLFPGFTELSATPRGAWVVGACGVRLRYLDAKLERHTVPARAMTVMMGVSCPAHRMHWSIWAASDEEAFALGSPRCGPDPSAVWPNELERFDGRRWMPIRAKFGAGDPHESDAFELGGAEGTIYVIVEGDSWHGPPDNAVVRLAGTRVEELRSALGAENRKLLELARANPEKHAAAVPNVIPYDDYEALVATSRDAVWVVGARRHYVGRNADGHGEPEKYVSGAVWQASKEAWSEYPIADEYLRAISVAPDGTVFVAGDGLWRKKPAARSFERLEGGWALPELGYGAQSVVARAADDVWIALGCGADACEGPIVLHHDGKALRRVDKAWSKSAPEEAKTTRRPRLDAKPGGPVWLLSEQQLWKLGG